jgi:hypothetical protein
MIPKIIWQTHENEYNDLLPFQKDITNTWKNLNPGWEYRYVSAEQRHIEVSGYSDRVYNYYLAADKIHQADIWRFITVYNHGGFYADMDSICLKGIDESLSKSYNGEELVCSPIGFQHYGINNSNFGAIKNSKILKSVIDKLSIMYLDIKPEDVPLLDFGFPENQIFADITVKNKDLICFEKEYFMHSKDFKDMFNKNVEVTVDDKKIKYGLLCKNNDWTIYYI